MNKGILWICFALILAILSAGVLVLGLSRHLEQPRNFEQTEITISPGQSFSSVLTGLHRQGLISSVWKLKLYARFKGCDKKLRAGEYLIPAGASPEKVLNILVQGKVVLHRITVPEGYSLRQIAETVDRAGLVPEAEFLAAADDPQLINEFKISGSSFEGYLFPDTYLFSRQTSAREIIEVMVHRFNEVFSNDWKERAARLGLSIHEVVVLASIVEKETGVDAERPVIASVFRNRLNLGMRLESDPTVIYGIENFDGNLTRTHLRTPTPYNTYTQQGLPPGPIASPGRKSLEAVLYPADTPYLFFVARKDRTHQFSATLTEHRKAVSAHQLSP